MANATFVLAKRKPFIFALEDDPEKTYALPAIKSLSFKEANDLARIDDIKSIEKKGEAVMNFILGQVPELKEKNLSDMEFFEIFNAYAMSEGREILGESKASQDS